MSEPTILVKKSDGTTARVPLSQFRAERLSSKAKPASTPTLSSDDLVSDAPSATGLPKNQISSPTFSTAWDEDDARPLIDDEPVLNSDDLSPQSPESVEENVLPTTHFAPNKEYIPIPIKEDEQVWRPALTNQSERPIIRDVSSPTPGRMSPIDELSAITPIDLRRLGENSESRALALRSKFEALKRESFISYQQGMRAFMRSPLFVEYLDTIALSLKNKKPVREIIALNSGPSNLSYDDVLAILHANRRLH